MAKKKRAAVKTKTKAKIVKKKKTSGKKRTTALAQLNYTLSPELAEIVGGKKMTRPQIVKKLWVYIKAKKCQDAKNRRLIVPDKKLSEVIGSKPVDMLKLACLLNKHIKKA